MDGSSLRQGIRTDVAVADNSLSAFGHVVTFSRRDTIVTKKSGRLQPWENLLSEVGDCDLIKLNVSCSIRLWEDATLVSCQNI